MGDKLNKRQPDHIGITAFARIVGLSRPTIYAYINAGLIKPIDHIQTPHGATRYVLSRADAEAIRAEFEADHSNLS